MIQGKQVFFTHVLSVKSKTRRCGCSVCAKISGPTLVSFLKIPTPNVVKEDNSVSVHGFHWGHFESHQEAENSLHLKTVPFMLPQFLERVSPHGVDILTSLFSTVENKFMKF